MSIGDKARDYAIKGQRNPMPPVVIGSLDAEGSAVVLRTFSGYERDEAGRTANPTLADQVVTGEIVLPDYLLAQVVSGLVQVMGSWVKPSEPHYPWEDDA